MGVGSRPPLPLYCVELLTLNFPAGGVRTAIDSIAFAVASTHFRPSTSQIAFAILHSCVFARKGKVLRSKSPHRNNINFSILYTPM